MERTVDVATPETVAFSFELAGLGSRFFAVFVDVAIQLAVTLVAFAVLAWIGSSHPAPLKNATVLDKTASAVLVAILAIVAFLLYFGYFIFFEWRFAGRTPGKRLLGIRVVRDGGFPLDFTAAVVRNVVRIVEFGLGFYAISAASTLLSPQNRRLGDYAAGTIVVRDLPYERVPVYVAPGTERAHDPLVRDLSEAERELVRRYVDRRPTLGLSARASVAADIAALVRPKLGINFAHLSDEDLLVHLAERALATS